MAWRIGGALLAAVCLVLTACTGPARTGTSSEPASGAIRMAVIGDSITDADSAHLLGGDIGEQSWVRYAIGSDIAFVGGWAEWGATTSRMASAVQEPLDADVLVILAGTNDLSFTPSEEIGANIREIARRAGVDSVVLVSVPPLDRVAGLPRELNAHLQGVADAEGWIWVDAMAALSEGEGDGDRFAPGMSYDGVHPTAEGARVIGEAIRAAILDALPAESR